MKYLLEKIGNKNFLFDITDPWKNILLNNLSIEKFELLSTINLRQDARKICDAGLQAVDPKVAVHKHLKCFEVMLIKKC